MSRSPTNDDSVWPACPLFRHQYTTPTARLAASTIAAGIAIAAATAPLELELLSPVETIGEEPAGGGGAPVPESGGGGGAPVPGGGGVPARAHPIENPVRASSPFE